MKRNANPEHLSTLRASGLIAGCLCVGTLVIGSPAAAAENPPAKLPPIAIATLNRPTPVDFAGEVLPILTQNCLACHNASEAAGELILESPETIRKGGESGPAVVPGQGIASRLLRAAAHEEADLVMPPPENKVGAGALTSEQLGLVKLWIDQGAGGAAGAARVVVRHAVPPAVRAILATAITPDDALVACNRGNRLFVYDLRGQRLEAQPADPALAAAGQPGAADEDLVRSLAFDRAGTLLAAGGFRTVSLWRRPVTQIEREITLAAPARSQAASPDGTQWALGTEAGGIELSSRGLGRIEAGAADGKAATKSIAAHQGAVTGMAFTPDGKRLYSAGLDKTVRAWDSASGAALGTFTLPQEVRALALADSGARLVTADADMTIRIWPADAVRDPPAVEPIMPLLELKGHGAPIVALAVPSTPGDRLISGSQDGRLKIWNLADGAAVRDLDHGGPLAWLAASPDGQRIVSVGAAGVARLWNAADGALVVEIKADPRSVRALERADAALNYARACVDYRKEEHREAEEAVKREMTAMEGGQKNKADTEKTIVDKTEPAAKLDEAAKAAEKALAEAEAAHKEVNDKRTAAKVLADAAELAETQARKAFEVARDAAAQDKDNAGLAAARDAAEKSLAELSARRQTALAAFNDTAAPIGPAQQKMQQADNARREAAQKAKTAQQELDDLKGVRDGFTSYLAAAAVAVERAKAAVPVAQQTIVTSEATLATREGEKKSLDPPAPFKPLAAAAFSADGKRLALAGEGPGILVFDGQRGTLLEVVEGHRAAVRSLAYVADRLVSSDAERRTIEWKNAGSWILERKIGRADEPGQLVDRVLGLDFHPDGRLLATAGGLTGRSGQLKLWNVADGQLVREIATRARDTIYCVRFSPDGQLLAAAGADRLVRIFRTADGSLVRTLAGHTHHVLGASWRPDGKLLATASGDHTVKVWDVDSGTALRTMRGDTYMIGEFRREVTSISFVGNTEHLLASAGDRTVRLLRTSSTRDVRTYKDSPAFMYSAVATSDGRLAIAGGQDGVLRVWNGENGYPVTVFADPAAPPAPAAASPAGP